MDKASRDTAVRVLKFLRLTERPQCGTRSTHVPEERGHGVRLDTQWLALIYRVQREHACAFASSRAPPVAMILFNFPRLTPAGACALTWRFKMIGLSTCRSA